MQEMWKPIKDFEGLYEVSNLGNVRSLDRIFTYRGKNQFGEYEINRAFKGQLLKPNVLKDGYAQVTLLKPECKPRYFKIHRLVAEAFIPNPDNKPQVNHKNGIRNDNKVTNLEWVTISKNHKHAFRELGKNPTRYWLGRASINRKLTKQQIDDIRNDSRSQAKIAKDYGVCQQTISNIKRAVHYVSW